MKPLNFKETFLPDKAILISEFILSFVIVSFGVFLVKINTYLSTLGQISVQQNLSNNFDVFQRTAFDASMAGRISAAVFWAIFGMLIYLIYWSIHNLIINFHNHEVIKLTYVHQNPDGENTKQYHRIVAAKILTYTAFIIFPLFIFSAIRNILPLVLQLGSYFASYPSLLDGWLAGICAVAISMLVIHIGIVLSRLAFGDYSII